MVYQLQSFLVGVLIAATYYPQFVLCGRDLNDPYQVPFLETNRNVSFSKTWQILGPFRSGTRGWCARSSGRFRQCVG